jgi:hypothetical protein
LLVYIPVVPPCLRNLYMLSNKSFTRYVLNEKLINKKNYESVIRNKLFQYTYKNIDTKRSMIFNIIFTYFLNKNIKIFYLFENF